MNKNKLCQWFTIYNVKSISPHIATFLLDIAEELKSKIKTVKDNELRKDLEDYQEALITVCCVAAVHQKAVIDKLSILIKGS